VRDYKYDNDIDDDDNDDDDDNNSNNCDIPSKRTGYINKYK